MRKGLIRLVAVLVTGSVLSLSGATMAVAGTAGHGDGVSATRSSAATLQALHDQLGTAIDAKDLQGVIKTIDRLRPQLAAVRDLPVDRSAMNVAVTADQKAAQAQRELPGLPGLPDPLSMLGGLLQGLLTAVQALIASLLGALPVPVPVPPLPVPVPAP